MSHISQAAKMVTPFYCCTLLCADDSQTDHAMDPLALGDCSDLSPIADHLKCNEKNPANCTLSNSNNTNATVMSFEYYFEDHTFSTNSCLFLNCLTARNATNLSCSLYEYQCSPQLCHDGEDSSASRPQIRYDNTFIAIHNTIERSIRCEPGSYTIIIDKGQFHVLCR